jgi:uncharacterized membrane protein
MRTRWVAALVAVAGVVTIVGVLGGGAPALAQQAGGRYAAGGPQLTGQSAPAPGTPGNPAMPGYGPGFGPGYGPGFGPGRFRGGREFGPRAGIAAGVFALGALLRFLLMIALLVIAWKVITLQSLWGRPDGAVQVVRERFARGEISEEEYRKRLVALS